LQEDVGPRGGMMRLRGGALYAASLTRWQHADMAITEPVHMSLVVNTTTVSWIGRSSVKEMLALMMRQCVSKTKPGDFARITHDLNGKKCYFYVISRANGLAGTLVTDQSYPQRVAINLMELLMDDFTKKLNGVWPQSSSDECVPYPRLEEYLAEYQESARADKIEALKKEVEESKKILEKSVEAILERGQKLEDLVKNSNKLSMQTKMMYKSVQKKPGWVEECLGCNTE